MSAGTTIIDVYGTIYDTNAVGFTFTSGKNAESTGLKREPAGELRMIF